MTGVLRKNIQGSLRGFMGSNDLTLKYGDQLPFEKLESGKKIQELSDADLLAILIGTGTKGSDVMSLSRHLIDKYGSLQSILHSGINEIARERGMGKKKTMKLKAAFELGKRAIVEKPLSNIISSPRVVWELLLPETANLEIEEFRVLSLNNKNKLLSKTTVSRGTINETLVHPREVFKDAVREAAAGIIVAHNHPSGNTEPSDQDIKTTERLQKAGLIMGIPLIDHIIITNTSFMSMKEEGYI